MDNKKQTIIAYISTSTTLLMLVGGVIYHIALFCKQFKENSVEVEVRAMVPLNRPWLAPIIVTRSIVRRPTPEPPPTPPGTLSGESISLDLENNDVQLQNENIIPLDDLAAASPSDAGDEDTVPLLENCL